MNDLDFVMILSLIYAFLLFLFTFTDIPSEYKFFSGWDFAWFAGGLAGVAGACVVAPSLTGAVGCPIALGVFSFVSIWNYVLVQNDILKLLVFTPLVVVTIYVVSKLARGAS